VKNALVLFVIAMWAWLSPAQALAQAPTINSLDPFHFGPGGLSGWQAGAGNPTSSGSDALQYGLYLQKSVPTATLTAAGADVNLKNVPDAGTITVLSFTISGLSGQPFGVGTGYCGAGAPRWTVITDTAGTCFLGCAHGDKTQNAAGWWEIKFVPPFTQYAGCGGGLPAGAKIESLFVVMDEGTDVGPGNVVIDDITINTRVFRKP
jgi:hypothetical protein